MELLTINKKIVYVLTACVLMCPVMTIAQKNASPEYQVKAVFLYNFTQFITWPDSVFSAPDAPLVIGIVGSDPFGPYLRDIINSEKAGNHPLVIKQFKTASEITKCHLLFINSDKPAFIEEALEKIEGHSTLTVCDSYSFMKLGGMVQFFIENNKIRLRINRKTAKAAQLNISSQLLKIADIYSS